MTDIHLFPASMEDVFYVFPVFDLSLVFCLCTVLCDCKHLIEYSPFHCSDTPFESLEFDDTNTSQVECNCNN